MSAAVTCVSLCLFVVGRVDNWWAVLVWLGMLVIGWFNSVVVLVLCH